MTTIPFMKLHGAENDFLLSWGDQVTATDLPEAARRICGRNTGIGADGWILAWPEGAGLRTRIFNSDGSEPELSGNGTRCAAAFGLHNGALQGDFVDITTAAGPKRLRVLSHGQGNFEFEMDMGLPKLTELHAAMELHGRTYDATILNVGNPQCAIFVDRFDHEWLPAAAEAEKHPRFPNRSNVSFVRVENRHSIEARFYERGAGLTKSSGTGSTGAAAAAILRGETVSPVEIQTQAGFLHLRWDGSVYLTGPAAIIGEGRFFLDF